jgi:thiol-disulfide isomerase/thioredoxin
MINLPSMAMFLRSFVFIVWFAGVATLHNRDVDAQEQTSPQRFQLLTEGNQALAKARFADAEKLFRKASKLGPDDCGPCYLGLTRAEKGLSNTDAALAFSERALTVASNDSERAAIHEVRGDILVLMHDPKRVQDAEREYETALQLNSEEPVFHLKLAVALMKEFRDTQGIEQIQRYLQLEPEGQYTEFAKKLAAHPRRAREEYVPAFQLTTLQGTFLSSVNLEGKIVVLDFWATWCEPCRDSISELKALTRKYPSDKLTLVSINGDRDENAWRDFVRKKDMDWPQYWDKDRNLRTLLKVNAFPTYILIDPEGIVRERIIGINPRETIVHRLKQKLENLLAPT